MTISMTDRELLAAVRSSDAGQEFLEQRQAALQEQRRQQAAELAERRKELDKRLPGLTSAVEKAKVLQEKAQAARMEALQAWATADRERRTFADDLGRRIAGLEQELRETASPEIRQFIGSEVAVDHPVGPGLVIARAESTGLAAEIKRTQAAPLTEWRHPTKGLWKNNQAQLSARITAIREAQRKAALLMLEALTPEEIAKRLQAIQAEIPAL